MKNLVAILFALTVAFAPAAAAIGGTNDQAAPAAYDPCINC